MSLENLPPELLAKPSKPWLTRILGALLLVGLLSWWQGPGVMHKLKSYAARHYAEAASEAIQAKEWLLVWCCW